MVSFFSSKRKPPVNRAASCLDNASYWDNYSAGYLSNNQISKGQINLYIKAFYYQLVSLALSRLEENKKPRILKIDLWNEGVETSRDILGKFGKTDAFSFDLSKNICCLAKERLNEVGIVQATCQNIPYASSNFDLLLDLSTIDHIPFNKTTQVFEEYYRLLKPKGMLAIAFWQSNIATKYLLHIDPEQLYFDSKKVANSLEKIGFKIVASYNLGALITLHECNFWIGDFLYWRLKRVFDERLFNWSAKLEPYIYNWLGGLRVYYAIHP